MDSFEIHSECFFCLDNAVMSPHSLVDSKNDFASSFSLKSDLIRLLTAILDFYHLSSLLLKIGFEKE